VRSSLAGTDNEIEIFYLPGKKTLPFMAEGFETGFLFRKTKESKK
jgi:hypothetical protein